MRQFLIVVGSVVGNFVLWTLITFLPVPQIIIILLSIAIGCLMLYSIVRLGRVKSDKSST
jgi:hypothetical protein